MPNCTNSYFVLVLSSITWIAVECKAENARIESLKDVAISNAECWKQMDVLIRTEMFSTDGLIDMGTKLTRMAIDFELEQCFVFETFQVATTSSEKGKEVETFAKVGTLIDKRGVEKSFPGFPNPHKSSSIFAFLTTIHAPDLRCIGLYPYPERYSFLKDSQSGFQLLAMNRNRTPQFNRLREVVFESTDTIKISNPIEQGKVKGNISYSFDPKTMMPQSIVGSIVRNEKLSPDIDERYRWKEIEGIFVPISIASETYDHVKDGPSEGRLTVQLVDIHWFKLNEPIDKALLEPGLLNDLSALRKLTDPSVFSHDR